MNIVILGCGRIGSTLSRSFVRDGHDVTIIDRNSTAFRRLGPDFRGRMVLGNGIDVEVLQKAGIEKAAAFIAVTNGDNTNIMSVQIAKEKYHVPQAIARIYDPIRACAYREAGIETVCTTIVGAKLIKNVLLGQELGTMSEYCTLSPEDPLV
jgi:trk system potassium uptake protein TrkA